MTPPNTQAEYWNDAAVASELRAGVHGPSGFVEQVAAALQPESHVVELGCGVGDDAAYLAGHGHSVIAIDVSEPMLDIAAQRFANLRNLEFRHADITRPLDVGGESADVVIARLSLHYFDDEVTERIFGEVFWVLRPAGTFHFLCKSIDDPLYGKGTEIGPDTFELDGHVRHFFSREYAIDLMEDIGFINVRVSTGADKFYGQPSAYVLCSGIKP